jgi:hypothetical protein
MLILFKNSGSKASRKILGKSIQQHKRITHDDYVGFI